MAYEYQEIKKAGGSFSTTMTLASFIQNHEWTDGAYDVVYNMESPVDLGSLSGKQSLWLLTKEAFEDIGKELYSKTRNFVSDNMDVYNCRPEALVSIAESLGMENHGVPDVSKYPKEVADLIEIFSIPLPKLLSYGILDTTILKKLYSTGYQDEKTGQMAQSVVQGSIPPGASLFYLQPPCGCSGTVSLEFTGLLNTDSITVSVYQRSFSGNIIVSTPSKTVTKSRDSLCSMISLPSMYTSSSFPANGLAIAVSGLLDCTNVLASYCTLPCHQTTYCRIYNLTPSSPDPCSICSMHVDLYNMDIVNLSATGPQFSMAVRSFGKDNDGMFDTSVLVGAYGSKCSNGKPRTLCMLWKSDRNSSNISLESYSFPPGTITITNLTTGDTTGPVTKFPYYADGTWKVLSDFPVTEGDTVFAEYSVSSSTQNQLFYSLAAEGNQVATATSSTASSGSSGLYWTSGLRSGPAMIEFGGFPSSAKINITS